MPTFNEAGNVAELIARLDYSLRSAEIKYELIFIDDNSTDDTVAHILSSTKLLPISVHLKVGKKGKAFSLLQGFKLASYNTIAMIDGDLQYPPEAIPNMLALLDNRSADVVIANRKTPKTSLVRTSASKINRTIFGKWLWGMDVDVQSGLKVFRKDILGRLNLNPAAWTFDLEFLVGSKIAGYKIGDYDIEFESRKAGQEKVSLLPATIQIVTSSLKLKFTQHSLVKLNPDTND